MIVFSCCIYGSCSISQEYLHIITFLSCYIHHQCAIYRRSILCNTNRVGRFNVRGIYRRPEKQLYSLLPVSIFSETIHNGTDFRLLYLGRPGVVYWHCASIFFLLLGYALVLVTIMLFFNLRFGQAAGVISVFVFSIYGFLLKPDTIQKIFNLPNEAYYKANVAIGWLSPLNHATYHMHNFGYDLLPRLWESFCIFVLLILAGYYASVWAIKNYNFNFTGTEG